MTDRTEYKEGETLILTSGCYSDYYIIGLFKVLKDFSTKDYTEEKLQGTRGWYQFKIDYEQLVRENILSEIDHTELWVKD